jgi:YVTN family beta-propeller protein
VRFCAGFLIEVILQAKFNDMKKYSWQILPALFVCGAALISATSINILAAADYQIFVTNEKSGDLTIIDGAENKVLATIPVGKRPRGIRVSPDGSTVYVAVSSGIA